MGIRKSAERKQSELGAKHKARKPPKRRRKISPSQSLPEGKKLSTSFNVHPLELNLKALEFELEPLDFKLEPLEFKLEPLDFKLEPLSVDFEPLSADLGDSLEKELPVQVVPGGVAKKPRTPRKKTPIQPRAKETSLSKLYGLDPLAIDFVDVDFADDLPLYVDPMLFWRSPVQEHHIVHALLVRFIDEAIAFVKAGKSNFAQRMCSFPEPENFIGLSRKGHRGRGASGELGQKIYEELINNPSIQETGLRFLNEFQFMIEGISSDFISDMTVNIAKEYFVRYTQRQAKLYGIPLKPALTRMYIWSENRWDDQVVDLPCHPTTHESFLLTPRAVVRRWVTLDHKKAWREVLRVICRDQFEKNRKWEGLGQPPKATWAQIEEEFGYGKKLVVKMMHEHPELRHRLTGDIKKNIRARGMEISAERLGLDENNQVLSLEALQELSRGSAGDPEVGKLLDTALGNSGKEKRVVTDFPSGTTVLITDEMNCLLERLAEELVVVLGSYAAGQEPNFAATKSLLLKEDYTPCVLSEMPDKLKENPRQKLFTYVAPARFVIVLDFAPSGHLNEIELIQNVGIPIVIISATAKGSSYMLQGIDENSFVHRVTLERVGTLDSAMKEALEWAESKIEQTKASNIGNLPWLKKY